MKVVEKIEEGVDPREVLCTTYQMRNPFRQFYDGVASDLDTMCYFMHAEAADLCANGARVLDVCAGRGLLIPFLRYRAKPSLYVGVDIDPSNARWKDDADPRREGEKKTDWGFPRVYVESNVATMVEPVRAVAPEPFDLVVYTSSIEHMQPSAQAESLKACGELAARHSLMYLSCPVTEQGRSGWETQYAAHVYEPSMAELETWLDAAGWKVTRKIGLLTRSAMWKKDAEVARAAAYLGQQVPHELLNVVLAALYPRVATEVGLICMRKEA